MKVKVVGVTKTSHNHSSIHLINETGRPVITLTPREMGHFRLTDDEAEAIVLALINQMPDEIELPDREDGYGLVKPKWVDTGATSVENIRVPVDVPRNEHGEIIVPPRHKNETPEEKRIRRA